MLLYIFDSDIEEELVEPTFDSILERAVLEAGFNTEELRHCIKELHECLYLRMLTVQTPFTDKEWEACQEAKRLLGLGAD
jgi:hypothetical protein